MARRYLARPPRLRLFCDALARSSGLGLSSYAHAAVRHSMRGRAHAVVVVMLRVYSSIIHHCARLPCSRQMLRVRKGSRRGFAVHRDGRYRSCTAVCRHVDVGIMRPSLRVALPVSMHGEQDSRQALSLEVTKRSGRRDGCETRVGWLDEV